MQSILTMAPVLTSFLPPFDVHLYIPVLFKLWRAFNSSVLDERLIELMGDLADEHAQTEGNWKDIGMWTDDEWTFMAAKMLDSMSMYHPDFMYDV
jgi:proteasome activator subunit 4